MSKTTTLGAATIYGIARKYGFTGTEKEWLDLQTTLRDEAKVYADNAKESEINAKSSETNAEAYKDSASSSATSSEDSNKLSESFAHGNTGKRINENTDNAKAYSEAAKASAIEAAEKLVNQDKILDEVNKKLQLASFDIDSDGNLIYTDNSSYSFTVSEDGYLNYEVV